MMQMRRRKFGLWGMFLSMDIVIYTIFRRKIPYTNFLHFHNQVLGVTGLDVLASDLAI